MDPNPDVRELRSLLKNAQNDVKRYAAHVVRLQQELDRARRQNESETTKPSLSNSHIDNHVLDQAHEDEDVDAAGDEASSALQMVEKWLKTLHDECVVCHHRPSESKTEQLRHNDTVATQLATVKTLVEKQSAQIATLARENAKLRDSLAQRPTHRDLARSQWQVESLQAQVTRLKEEQRSAKTDAHTTIPVYDPPPHETLSDRISVDKLLSWLHVETKKVKHPLNASASKRQQSRRRFLKEPVECYLVLDSAALDSDPLSASATENDRMKKREQMSRRVGILCSEIVASCCHSVGVYEIAKLPRYVEATYQYAQLVPYLQDFVHRIDSLTQAAAPTKRPTTRRASVDEDPDLTDNEGFLDNLAARVQDLVFEVRARRDQMKPPGDVALATALRCMRVLQVHTVNDLVPTVEKLIATTRHEKEFMYDVRKVLGLDVAASRHDVLSLIRQLLETTGLSPASTSGRRI